MHGPRVRHRRLHRPLPRHLHLHVRRVGLRPGRHRRPQARRHRHRGVDGCQVVRRFLPRKRHRVDRVRVDRRIREPRHVRRAWPRAPAAGVRKRAHVRRDGLHRLGGVGHGRRLQPRARPPIRLGGDHAVAGVPHLRPRRGRPSARRAVLLAQEAPRGALAHRPADARVTCGRGAWPAHAVAPLVEVRFAGAYIRPAGPAGEEQ
mmetsp:Transcript_11498/g.35725  ORF Transcript_11498/g.35725 Transcript_11498/m.35725 type:complete len:204 (+) Transcript_11498:351-962(+)